MDAISNPLIANLPVLPRNVLSRQSASYHRSGINKDSGNFLYIDEKGESVLFDAYGPGCIRSIFATNLLGQTDVKFYFDGGEEPRYALPIQEFFSGEHPDFPAPSVSYRTLGYHLGEESKAGNCLLPVGFKESLKITVTGDTDIFYHILWEQYPHGTPVAGFPDRESLRNAADLWSLPGAQDKPGWEDDAGVDLEPGKKVSFFKSEGSACITSITIEAGCVDTLLEGVLLCIRWDDLLYDSVHAPLGHFFTVPSGIAEVDTPLITVKPLDDGKLRLVCRWPMPYWKEASLSLLNLGDITIPKVRVRVETVAQTYNAADCGYFTAQYRAGGTVHGVDWTLFQGRGWGKYVGTIQRMLGEHYCEGDEHFTLDGACTPQINGTGSEDYYLFCFWPNPLYCTPYNGSTVDVYQKGGGLGANAYRYPAAYYRFHLDGPIAFYGGIDARIQHGGMSHIHSQYASLGICYLQKNPALNLGDYIDLGSRTSREAHAYRAETAETVIVESSFIGNEIDVRERLSGYAHAGGEISFTVAIDPENRGALLRRRIDQAHDRQKAEVYIDGQFAGEWYDANYNPVHRWYDSDFLVPTELCRDKEALHVRLQVIPAGEDRFTDFSYSVYSFDQPAAALFPTRQTVLGEWLKYAD